jgi:hypothetical protein
MQGNKIYDLRDPKDVKKLNNLLNPAGIHFEYSLLDIYVLIDLDRYTTFSKRKAGRRTIINKQLRLQVFSLRYQKYKLREIAAATNISTATVREILKDYEEEKETDQLSFDF